MRWSAPCALRGLGVELLEQGEEFVGHVLGARRREGCLQAFPEHGGQRRFGWEFIRRRQELRRPVRNGVFLAYNIVPL